MELDEERLSLRHDHVRRMHSLMFWFGAGMGVLLTTTILMITHAWWGAYAAGALCAFLAWRDRHWLEGERRHQRRISERRSKLLGGD